MKGIALLSAALAIVLTLAMAIPADAHHYLYTAEDPGMQWLLPTGTENWVFYWWWAGWPAYWWADATMAELASIATAVWTIKIPQLTLYYYDNPDLADLRFRFEEPPLFWCGFPTPAGCMNPDQWEFVTPPNANYIKKATIYLNPTFSWSPEGKNAVTAHELGHFYGLHEQYIDDTKLCNPDVISTMDGTEYNASSQLVHCDGIIGPTDLDAARVKAYWSGGYPLHANLPITGFGNGPEAFFRWHDMAWAEKFHRIKFYYKSGSDWVFINEFDTSALIGVHLFTEDRTIGLTFNRNNWGTPPAYYRACAWAWFEKFGQWGNGRCSMDIWLN